MLYELYNAHRKGEKGWTAAIGAVFNLRSDALRPEGWTSADAAGLPIFPLLARYPEVASGQIDHALRVTVPETQRGYIHPATHFASEQLEPEPAADGPAPAPEGELQPRGLPRRVAGDPRSAEALRADRRRQRLAVVHHRRAQPAAGTTKTSNRSSRSPARNSKRSKAARSCTAEPAREGRRLNRAGSPVLGLRRWRRLDRRGSLGRRRCDGRGCTGAAGATGACAATG